VAWTVSQPDVVVRSIGQLLDTDADLSARRLADNRRLSQVAGYVPPFLNRWFGVGVSWRALRSPRPEHTVTTLALPRTYRRDTPAA
jgi:hypothetical protein